MFLPPRWSAEETTKRRRKKKVRTKTNTRDADATKRATNTGVRGVRFPHRVTGN